MQKPKKRNWLILALAALTLVITTFGATPKAQAATSYYQVANLKKVDYYTKVGANTTHNYGIYTSGGYKTSAANVTAIAHGRDYAGKYSRHSNGNNGAGDVGPVPVQPQTSGVDGC
ncbi:hypothetical protein [Secundilactobacillus paracollinoides]|uniref:hypothetical protein n=1 Tax=Secundilactobacillus paracollinoides TaxID=240427 RepID=UPI000AF031FD|nr:hypothetical protein [Secundilactobacillus paracollinoides]